MAPKPPQVTAFGLSVAIHGLLALLLLIFTGIVPESVDTKAPPIRTGVVYLQQATPGGGSGGRPVPAPPQQLQVPVHRKPALAVEAVAMPIDPPPVLDVPVRPNSTILQGSGITPSAPPGPGGGGPGLAGIGPGAGPGAGPGRGAGIDGASCSGVMTYPFPIREARPAFTPGAMAAKIQGTVTLEVEVLANGSVGTVKVLRSLDRVYGLDQEAIRAARQWVFTPGTSCGRRIDSTVQIILEFNLR
jgi:protein TonB